MREAPLSLPHLPIFQRRTVSTMGRPLPQPDSRRRLPQGAAAWIKKANYTHVIIKFCVDKITRGTAKIRGGCLWKDNRTSILFLPMYI